jgi:hypothetical protein
MPCYTAWDECYPPGTPEHDRVKAEVRAKLATVKHIIDYYYDSKGFSKPNLPIATSVNAMRQPKSKTESGIREAICYHFGCDEIGVSTLLDVCTQLDESCTKDRAYLAVILPCIYLLREYPEKFNTTYS